MRPLFLLPLVAASTLPILAQVTLTKDVSAPASNVITGLATDGGSFTTVFDADSSGGNAGGDRGQTFTMPDIPGASTQWLVSELVVVSDAARDLSSFSGAQFTVWVFEWSGSNANDQTNWASGTGSSAGNPFTGTGISNFLVDGATTPAALSFVNNDVLHFEFSPPLAMQENQAYGFLISFDDGSATSNGTNSDLRLQLSRDNTAPNGEDYPEGFNLVLNGSNYTASVQNTDDLRFYIVGTPNSTGQTYVWTAGGDGSSLFDEANWTLNGDGTNSIPSIEPAIPVNHHLVINSGTPGGGGANGSLDLGIGSLTANAGTMKLNLSADRRISNGPVTIAGGTVVAEGLKNVAATLSSGRLELDAPRDPLLDSTIDFSAASTATLAFNNETPADVLKEHLSKITIDGQAAVIGSNFTISAVGSGSELTRFSGNGDVDNDNMPDAWELAYFMTTNRSGALDFDNDGLSDLAEFNAGTNPTDDDSDDDLLRDGDETSTNPAVADSDGDGNPDGFEIAKGTDPNDANSKTDRPNIIYIFCDDLGYGDLGVLHQNGKTGKKHKTPFLDQMASEGMILDRHYCPAPVCAPSRASLLTGMHQGHANVRDNQFDKALENNHTLASVLRSAGYHTSIIGKWGLQGSGGSPELWPAYPTKRGFDDFFGYVGHGDGHTHYPDHVTESRSKKPLYDGDSEISDELDKCFTPDLFTARAKKLITDEVEDGDNEPFFLYLAYDTPHAALQIPTIEYPGENNSNDLDTLNLGKDAGVQWLGTPGQMINTATGTIDSYRHPDYTGNGWSNTEERFATLVRRMDDCVGDLRKTLDDLGIANDTLIVFSADNGPHSESYLTDNYNPTSFQSYGPFEGEKRDCWEGGIRQPTLVCWPGTIAPGTTNTTPSQLHDWLATLSTIAGWPQPARIDGTDLTPTLTGTGIQKTPVPYIEYDNNANTSNYSDFANHGGADRSQTQVIFIDGYKGIRNNPTSAAGDFQIYDTLTDLNEANNLAGSSAYFIALQQQMKDSVLRLRQPDSSAPRPWDSAEVPAISPAPSVQPGLNWKTYTGLWPWVPEFTSLTETATGSNSNFSLSMLPSTTNDRGILYTGFISIPTGGSWTFHLDSDSGSILRIHDILVVDNDFNHDGSEQSGSVLLEAGLHPFHFYYTNRTSTAPSLSLDWSGPGVVRQTIPDTALFIEGTPGPEPIGIDDTDVSINGAAILIDVLANDIDDGLPSALSISSVSSAAHGSAAISGNQIQYTPNRGFYGSDSFTYSFTDGEFTSAANVSLSTIYQASDFWVPLNEGSGTAIHEAGDWLAGTLANATDAAHIDGVHGKALRFDGTDDEVLLSTLPTLPSGSSPRTVMAWIRVEPNTAFENQCIFGYGLNNSGQRFTFRLNGSAAGTANQPLRLEVQSGSIVGTTNVADGQWHHVCTVIPAGSNNVTDALLYLDGSLETISSFTAQALNTAANTTPVLGGSNHAAGYNFAGDIDELRIYPVGLSQSEIQAIIAADHQAATAWHRARFGDSAIDWNADDDGDGMSRLLEYALISDPRINSQDALPSLGYDGSNLTFSFERLSDGCHELDYSVTSSEDLTGWLPVSPLSFSLAPGSTSCSENITFDLGGTTPDKRFFRLEVEFAP